MGVCEVICPTKMGIGEVICPTKMEIGEVICLTKFGICEVICPTKTEFLSAGTRFCEVIHSTRAESLFQQKRGCCNVVQPTEMEFLSAETLCSNDTYRAQNKAFRGIFVPSSLSSD